jgi:hypothetical protein
LGGALDEVNQNSRLEAEKNESIRLGRGTTREEQDAKTAKMDEFKAERTKTQTARGKEVQDQFTAVLKKGGGATEAMEEFRVALQADVSKSTPATTKALDDARKKVRDTAGSMLGDDATALIDGIDKRKGGQTTLDALNAVSRAVAQPAIEAYNERMSIDRKNLNRFTVGSTDANAMQAKMGGPAFNIMKKALEGSIEDTEAGNEELARASLGMNVNQRGSAMEMMNENQKAVVARSSHVYESMTNKKHSRGQQILGGLMQLEGAMDSDIMNQDFTTGILKRVNAGKGLSNGDMDGIDRLLKAHKVGTDDIIDAKKQLQTMADKGKSKEDRAAAAKEFAVIAGGAGGKIGGGGGSGKGGDMTANIEAFNAAIGKAASVISEAAAGKNMSGPA